MTAYDLIFLDILLPEKDGLEVCRDLRRRYARGEIDGTTFDQMRERLESSGRPRD